MARPKRPPHPLLAAVRWELMIHAPDLATMPLAVRQLDGPPDGPRFVVSGEQCLCQGRCPHDITDAANCPIRECAMRASLRWLYRRDGTLIQLSRSHIRHS